MRKSAVRWLHAVHVHLPFGDHGAHVRIAALGTVSQQVDGKPHASEDLFPRRSCSEKGRKDAAPVKFFPGG